MFEHNDNKTFNKSRGRICMKIRNGPLLFLNFLYESLRSRLKSIPNGLIDFLSRL